MTRLPIRNTVEGSRPVAVLVRNRIADEASFTQEVTRPQCIQYHSLALSRDDCDLHFSSLNKIDRVRPFSLRKEFCVLTKSYQILTHDNVFEHALDRGIDLRGFQPSSFLTLSIVITPVV